MPRDKDRKRIIRDRMKKTGESYTAARAHVISAKKTDPGGRGPRIKEGPAAPQIPGAGAPGTNDDLAERAGFKDGAIVANTGRTWEQWVRTLDAAGAATLRHRDIARLVHEKYKVGDWWSQGVTVGYERIKGLRERGQRLDGTYEAGKSRTFDVPVRALFDAWAEAAVRRRWLAGVKPIVRTATAPKSMRLQWPDGTLVLAGFWAKGAGRSAVAVTHTKLRDRAASAKAKEYWTGRLDALESVLSRG